MIISCIIYMLSNVPFTFQETTAKKKKNQNVTDRQTERRSET